MDRACPSVPRRTDLPGIVAEAFRLPAAAGQAPRAPSPALARVVRELVAQTGFGRGRPLHASWAASPLR